MATCRFVPADFPLQLADRLLHLRVVACVTLIEGMVKIKSDPKKLSIASNTQLGHTLSFECCFAGFSIVLEPMRSREAWVRNQGNRVAEVSMAFCLCSSALIPQAG